MKREDSKSIFKKINDSPMMIIALGIGIIVFILILAAVFFSDKVQLQRPTFGNIENTQNGDDGSPGPGPGPGNGDGGTGGSDGDFSGDGVIGNPDLNILASEWLCQASQPNCEYDLDLDENGVIDTGDLSFLIENYDENFCGNGIQEPSASNGQLTGGEQCDDGNTIDDDGCSNTCMDQAQGGGGDLCDTTGDINLDGHVNELDYYQLLFEWGEWEEGDCDNSFCAGDLDGDGDIDIIDFLDLLSRWGPLDCCGDGQIEPGLETCDDGDASPGDGCNQNCQIEDGWICAGEPSVCSVPQAVCGDGIIDPPETCEDGNTNPGDGCDQNCQIEDGWHCSFGNPSTCWEIICGDFLLQGNEQCDDGMHCEYDGINPPKICFIGDGLPNFCEGIGDEICKKRNYGCNTDCKIMPGFECVQSFEDLADFDYWGGYTCLPLCEGGGEDSIYFKNNTNN